MENEAISQNEKEIFLATSALFLKEFEKTFIDYFVCLCVSYDNTIAKEEAHEIALSIYQNIFKCDDDISGLKKDLFVRMRQDGVMIGFFINRSMFYLIENYISFAKQNAITPETELFIRCVSHFINLIENKVTDNVTSYTGSFDINFSDDIMFSPTNNIIETFHHMKDDNHNAIFLNLYKGVPISSEAKIVDIDGENVTFLIDKLQEIAMKLDGQAFIVKNSHFSKHLKADIVYSNFQANTVVLTNFIYLLNMPALQREFIRVHPDIIAKVFLYQSGGNLQTVGRLYDLSMSGLGVVSSENNGMVVGAKVIIEFELNSSSVPSNGDRKIAVEGEVMNVIDYKDSYRYCMRIFPDRIMTDKILHYITQREHEILEDLNSELKEYIE